MERWNGRVALVTGASVGIGAAICRELAKYGMTVVGCARNVEKIQALAEEEEFTKSPGKLHPIKCDLSQESEILAMFEEIRSKFGRIDVCINNAGFSSNSPLLSGQTSDWKSMLEVNILALAICSREAVKLMTEKSIAEGQIININSMGGHQLPQNNLMPGFNFYCGTKSMVTTLTKAMRFELTSISTPIRISSISPGLVETEFLPRCLDPMTASAVYGTVPCLQAQDVAAEVVHILRTPQYLEVNDVLMTPFKKSSAHA